MNMSRAFVCFAMAAGIASLAGTEAKAQPSVWLSPAAIDLDHVLGKPIRHGNLTITPIYGLSRDKTDYLTLDEAFDQQMLKVAEVSSDEVNQLEATNLSSQPIFVMAGEIMLGGKQDRIVAKSIIVGAKTTVRLDVYCVEHGRWSEEGGNNRAFRSAKKSVHTKLRAASQFQDQGAVWAHVASKNQARGTANSSDTYRAVVQDGATAKTTAAYIEAIMAELQKVPLSSVSVPAPPDVSRSYDLRVAPLAGIVTSYGDQIQSVEIFSSSELFAKLSRKLVESAALDAVDAPRVAHAGAGTAPTPASVTAFLADARAAKAVVTSKTKAATATVQVGELTSKATVTANGREVYSSTQPNLPASLHIQLNREPNLIRN